MYFCFFFSSASRRLEFRIEIVNPLMHGHNFPSPPPLNIRRVIISLVSSRRCAYVRFKNELRGISVGSLLHFSIFFYRPAGLSTFPTVHTQESVFSVLIDFWTALRKKQKQNITNKPIYKTLLGIFWIVVFSTLFQWTHIVDGDKNVFITAVSK